MQHAPSSPVPFSLMLSQSLCAILYITTARSNVIVTQSPNALYYGDNLAVLQEYVPDESVDLIYLDPPFNSNASYNVLFREHSGEDSPAQIKAFTDTWHWTEETERTYELDIIQNRNTPLDVKEMMAALRQFLGRNDMTAYLVMMAPRLVELKRVLKPTGSVYLHCDPTAGHYLKLLMDAVFGKENFRNEIVWRRTGSHNQNRRFGPIHDTIFFFYTKTNDYTFNVQFQPVAKGHVDSYFRRSDERGRYWTNSLTGAGVRRGDSGQPWRGFDPTPKSRHWAVPGRLSRALGIDQRLSVRERLEELYQRGYIDLPPEGSEALPTFRQYLQDSPGIPLQDVWAYQPHTKGVLYDADDAIDEDVRWIPRQGGTERLGYQTQKPVGIVERIIQSSSNPGDVVLDPFCGCGTAVAAAENLGRRWLGIDITHLAVALMKSRIKTAFNLIPDRDYQVVGEPQDVGSARALWQQDPFQFQYWAVSLLEAEPKDSARRGPDQGVDGVLYFIDGPRRSPQKVVIQVKGGRVSSPDIRDLKGVIEREKAAFGLFITLEKPTRAILTEAASGGLFHSHIWNRDYAKVQIRTIAQMLEGRGFDLPPVPSAYQSAQRIRRPQGEQGILMETRAVYTAGDN